jgi:hypothetical protein
MKMGNGLRICIEVFLVRASRFQKEACALSAASVALLRLRFLPLRSVPLPDSS